MVITKGIEIRLYPNKGQRTMVNKSIGGAMYINPMTDRISLLIAMIMAGACILFALVKHLIFE